MTMPRWVPVAGWLLLVLGGVLFVFWLFLLRPPPLFTHSYLGEVIDLATGEDGCLMLARALATQSPAQNSQYLTAKMDGKMVDLPENSEVKVLDGRVLREDRLIPYSGSHEPDSSRTLVHRVVILTGKAKGLTGCIAGKNLRAKWPML
jgi:hypothetical protein